MLDSNNSRVLVADCGPNYGRTIMAETLDSALWLLKQCRFEQLWVGDYLPDGDPHILVGKALDSKCLPLEVNFIGKDKRLQKLLADVLLKNGYALSKGCTTMYVKDLARIATGTRDWAESPEIRKSF